MASTTKNLLQFVLPKIRGNDKGVSFPNLFNPSSTTSPLGLPRYNEHLTDIYSSRSSESSMQLISRLAKHDPDVSATIDSYLNLSSKEPNFYVYDMEGNLDREGMKTLEQLILNLTSRYDYSDKFRLTKSLNDITSELKYSILTTGACGAELVFDKTLLPREFRIVDMTKIEWLSPSPGVYKPRLNAPGANQPIDLDIPNFFVSFYKQNPTEIYSYSPFVSCINTIAARQQIINDLYRVMQRTQLFGDRVDITVIEEAVAASAPAEFRADPSKLQTWKNEIFSKIRSDLAALRPGQAYVHTDAVKVDTVKDRGLASGTNVEDIIEVLNAQNQAALKIVPTLLGRGDGGVNTASTESRMFCLAVDVLNKTVADFYSKAFSLAMLVVGYEGTVYCKFPAVELRPDLELEPQLTMKQSRLLQALSLGLITDDEYHIEMRGELPPDGLVQLSGTNFLSGGQNTRADEVSPNSDPLGRSLSPEGSKSAKSNTVKK